MSQHSIDSLQKLSAISLRTLLTSIGSRKSGNKLHLVQRLYRDLSTPKIPLAKGIPQGSRILSIDMGIRNLAYCLTSFTSPEAEVEERSHSTKSTLEVLAWARTNVLQSTAPSTHIIDDAENPFSPESLAPVALHLVNDVFLPLKPSVILIERQRFRSGGAAAVQEWTLRVNTLEAMLWAVMCTLRQAQDIEVFPEVCAVSPAAVAAYWFPDARVVKKKEKVDFVRDWLSTGRVDKKLEVGFAKDLEGIKQGFLTGRTKLKVPRTDLERKDLKLDDLADCFLQAAAWASWETNRKCLNAQHHLVACTVL
jgi:cruciform cutting endonuclease 1